MSHSERHRTLRIGALRATVLGTNDGIVSTARLVLGIAAVVVDVKGISVAGVAGLVAGTMPMATVEPANDTRPQLHAPPLVASFRLLVVTIFGSNKGIGAKAFCMTKLAVIDEVFFLDRNLVSATATT